MQWREHLVGSKRSKDHAKFAALALGYATALTLPLALIAAALFTFTSTNRSQADVPGCNSATDLAGQLFMDFNANGSRDDAIYTGASGSLDASVGGATTTTGNGIDGSSFPAVPVGGNATTNPASFWGARTPYPAGQLASKGQPLSDITVTVKLFDSNDSEVASYPVTNGTWLAPNVASQLPLRVEYSDLPSGNSYTFTGDGSVAPVHFATVPGCAYDAGVYRISEYCQTNPSVSLTCNFAGVDGATSQTIAYNAAEKLEDSNSDSQVNSADASNPSSTITKLPTGPTNLALNSMTGPIWGSSYHRASRWLYVSTATSGSGGFQTGQPRTILSPGPGGVDRIYRIDTTNPSPNAATLFDVSGITALGVTYPDAIGTTSLGGMDIAEDSSALYVTNLEDRELVRLSLNGAGTAVSAQSDIAIPNPCDTGIANNEFRPFAVKVWHANVYVGTVCSQETKGFIQRYDGSSWTTEYATVPAEITKVGGPHYTDLGYYATLYITGLEFDTDGSIIIGTSAGPGHTDFSQGDIYIVEKSGSSYTAAQTFNPASQQFYNNTGGFTMLRGSGQIIHGTQNPTTTMSNGLAWLNTSLKTVDKKYSIYRTVTSPYDGTLAESNAIGELEVLCELAPIQIGNRVWAETAQQDGIQQANEPGVQGVTINLYEIDVNDNEVLVGTTTTSANGSWSFGGSNNVSLNSGYAIKPYTDYIARVDNQTDFEAGGSLEDGQLTTINPSAPTNINNDAISLGTPGIQIQTQGPGENSIFLAFGFVLGSYTSIPGYSGGSGPGSSGGGSGVQLAATSSSSGLLSKTGSEVLKAVYIGLTFIIVAVGTLLLTRRHFKGDAPVLPSKSSSNDKPDYPVPPQKS